MAEQETDESIELVASAYTLTQLANLYKVTRPTMYAWIKPFMKELGKREGYFFTIEQVKLIIEKLGSPFKITEATTSAFISRKGGKFAKVHNVGKYMKTINSGYNFD